MGYLKHILGKLDVSVEAFNGIEFGIRHVNGEDLEGMAFDDDEVVEYKYAILVSFAFLSFLFAVKK